MPAMTGLTGQFFFTTIAALALSTAGFASLVTALRTDGRWSRDALWRLRGIVGESLTITLVAVLPLPVYYAVGGDEPLTIRIISGLLVLKFVRAIWTTLGERAEWGRAYAVRAVLVVGVQLLAQLANVWLASLALLMFGLLAWFSFPIQLLFRILRDFQPPVDGE
jgi:hypothetical protein